MRLLVVRRQDVVVVGAPCHSLGQGDDETHHEVLDDPEDGARGGPHAPHHPLHPSSRSRGDSLLKRKEHSLSNGWVRRTKGSPGSESKCWTMGSR